MVYWLILLFASATEILWALTLKGLSQKVTPWLVAACLFLTFLNIGLLALAMRGIPASTAYAVWTGLGAAGIATVGILFLGEAATPARIICLVVIVAGVVGLRLTA